MSTYKTFNLYLEEYCDRCGDFEADVEKMDASSFGEKMYITDIRCKNADRCRRMYEHIVQQSRVWWFMGKKKLKRKIANLEDDMSSLLIENEKLRNIISGMQSYVKSYWGAEIKVIDKYGIVEFKNN